MTQIQSPEKLANQSLLPDENGVRGFVEGHLFITPPAEKWPHGVRGDSTAAVHEAYVEWCAARGLEPVPQKRLSWFIGQVNGVRYRANREYAWRNVHLQEATISHKSFRGGYVAANGMVSINSDGLTHDRPTLAFAMDWADERLQATAGRWSAIDSIYTDYERAVEARSPQGVQRMSIQELLLLVIGKYDLPGVQDRRLIGVSMAPVRMKLQQSRGRDVERFWSTPFHLAQQRQTSLRWFLLAHTEPALGSRVDSRQLIGSYTTWAAADHRRVLMERDELIQTAIHIAVLPSGDREAKWFDNLKLREQPMPQDWVPEGWALGVLDGKFIHTDRDNGTWLEVDQIIGSPTHVPIERWNDARIDEERARNMVNGRMAEPRPEAERDTVPLPPRMPLQASNGYSPQPVPEVEPAEPESLIPEPEEIPTDPMVAPSEIEWKDLVWEDGLADIPGGVTDIAGNQMMDDMKAPKPKIINFPENLTAIGYEGAEPIFGEPNTFPPEMTAAGLAPEPEPLIAEPEPAEVPIPSISTPVAETRAKWRPGDPIGRRAASLARWFVEQNVTVSAYTDPEQYSEEMLSLVDMNHAFDWWCSTLNRRATSFGSAENLAALKVELQSRGFELDRGWWMACWLMGESPKFHYEGIKELPAGARIYKDPEGLICVAFEDDPEGDWTPLSGEELGELLS